MTSQKVDCCCGETTCIGIAGQNQIEDEKCDMNVLTDCTLNIVTNSKCELESNEHLKSNFSSRPLSTDDLDTANVKCDSSVDFSNTLENNSDACDSKNNLQPGNSQRNNNTQENPRRKNFIVQYFAKKCEGWHWEQFLIILILSFVEFFASAVVSIQAPFYPDVARQKGATASEYGLVFGIFQATIFIMSPFYGAKMGSLGPRRVYNWGIFITGSSCIIFGLLNHIGGRVPFILMCVIVRVVEAMGAAAFQTASFTIIAAAFPQSVATSYAILEFSFGLGIIIGPTVGGALYQLGGYSLPFVVMGSLLFASALVTHFFLPDPNRKNVKSETALESSSQTTQKVEPAPPLVHGGFQMFKLLKIPVIAMSAYSIVAATIGIGLLSANLEHHLEQFQLNKLSVGLVFIIGAGVYTVTAPVWGWICDHVEHPKIITLAGAIFIILGFILIGPVPYFPFDTSLQLTCVGLVLDEIGIAAIFAAACLQVLRDAIAHGYPDDISTYGLVSSIWISMTAFGNFIGPLVGGILDDLVGFRWSLLFVIAGMVVLIILLAGNYASNCRQTTASNNLAQNRVEGQLEEDFKTDNGTQNAVTISNDSVAVVHKNDSCEIINNSDTKMTK